MKADSVPLSFAQERICVLDRLDPGNPFHHLSAVFRLRGTLDQDRLVGALTGVTRRNAVLRMRLRDHDGVLVQERVSPSQVPLVGHDLGNDDDRLAALLDDHARQPFDLERDPPFRAALVRLDEHEHLLVFTVHHVVFDGDSFPIFLRDLAAAYGGLGLGVEDNGYEVFATAERRRLADGGYDAPLAYWKDRLAGVVPVELPFDHPRPPRLGQRRKRITRALRDTTAAALIAAAATLDVPIGSAWLGAFMLLLWRYSGQDDVVVGMPSRKGRTDHEGTVGLFVDNHVIRAAFSEAATTREMLARVHGSIADADREHVPFQLLLETLKPQRDLSRSPLFQVYFGVVSDPALAHETDALTIQLDHVRRTPAYDVSLFVRPETGQLAVVYNEDLFESATIERLLANLEVVAAAIPAMLDRPCVDVPFLSDAERRTLLVEWNNTTAPLPDLCVHDLVAEHVRRRPSARAVVHEQALLTYSELGDRSAAIAGGLAALGVVRGDLVAVCLTPCVDLPAALLGVFTAGAAYLPIDPSYPAERRRFMIEDAKPRALVTTRALVGQAPDISDVLFLDELQATTGDLRVASTPDDLAYVIYTSGSTGRPKGVEIRHRGLVNLLRTMATTLEITESDVVLGVASYAFDMSVPELFLAVSLGGCAVIVSRDTAADGAALAAEIVRSEATVVHATPTTWRLLVDAGWSGGDRVRAICGAEALPRSLADELRQRVSRLWNLYGPTETTVWATYHDVVDTNRPIPIGRVLANTEAYVLDRRRQLLPIGATGELYLGGVGVARGYLGRPELTRERFVEHPFHEGTLYRTGDICRWRSDNALEFLGRGDHQVKVNGFRIELEEIEVQLERHDAVERAVVVAREDGGQKRLAAFLVGKETNASLLREHLAASLPPYMIPSRFVWLPDLPLGVNGKIDRARLPELLAPVPSGDARAPNDILELELLRLFEDTLKLSGISVRDDFFVLGGDSLSAMRVLSGVRAHLGVTVPFGAFFGASTVERLAYHLRQARSGSQTSRTLVPLKASGSRPPFFCVHPVGGTVLCYFDLARHLGADYPFYGLQARGIDGEAEPFTTFPQMAASYVEAIRTVQPHGPYFLGGWSMGAPVAYEMAQQLVRAGERIALLVAIDGSAPTQTIRDGVRSWFPDPLDDENVAHRFIINVTRGAGQATPPARSLLRGKSRSGLLEAVLEHLRQHELVTAETTAGDIAPLFEQVRTNLWAFTEYEAAPYTGRVTLIVGRDPHPEFQRTATMGWDELTSDLEIRSTPGDHYNVVDQHNAPALALQLRACIDAASS